MKTEYSKQGDYLLPNLLPPQDCDNRPIGKYGRIHRDYLKNYRSVLYTNLLTSGKLHSHLCDIEKDAQSRMELLIRQMKKAQGITEQFKADKQMEWVGRMNNIRNAAEELILKEIIYA